MAHPATSPTHVARPTGTPDRALAQARARERSLVAWLRAQGSVVVGFSGGVDSAYLACVAHRVLGPERALAIIGRSASYPVVQWERAREVADQLGLRVLEVDTDELHDPRYAANPSNRCYFCKSELWSRVLPVARAQGMSVVVDGTNADDLHGHRPGAAAAAEREVRSPLAELGFTKDEIRLLSREHGLPTWSQPSSPCLASRIPYGTAVTIERLRDVEVAEEALRALGVTGDLRVRHHGALARLELTGAELARWMPAAARARLRDAVRTAGFARVALDLGGFRSGSLNLLGAPAHAATLPDAAAALERALAEAGTRARVEVDGRLALLRLDDPAVVGDEPVRRRVLALAAEQGLTHAAVELEG